VNAKAKTTSAALVSAVALASGAYALGTQSDGSASAARDRAAGPMGYGAPPGTRPMHRRFDRRGPGLDAAAKKLGVTPAKLRSALEEIRKEERDTLATKLADKLGVSKAKVKEALPDRPKMRFRGGPGGPPGGGPPPPGAPPYGPPGP
jgi:hypothetical protein